MQIVLLHRHYNQEQLEQVKAEMVKLGSPMIRTIWSEMYGFWLAVEGSHRLRAAAELGISPKINDISNHKIVTIQVDGDYESVAIIDLLEELQDNARHSVILSFD